MSKPERILKAALEVIAEKGPHETTIDEIAQRAGVAKGTVYLYFKNKDSLLASLMQVGLDAFDSAVRRRVALHTEPLEQLRALIEEHVTQMHNHVKFGKIIWSQTSHATLPPDLKDVFRDRARSYVDLLSTILERGQDCGSMQVLDTRMTARAIIGSMNQAVFDFTDPDFSSGTDCKTIIESIIFFIFNGVIKSGGN
ncbi:MAG: TetR/AcrR family transcriptional regulator [Bacillota bacterium]|nr:TetR/AcrR family transcriptional regulator [Bacillota bacterium]